MNARAERLMPKGVPRYVRCYDAGDKVGDRYTVVFTRVGGNSIPYLGMSAEPFHPQGIGQHGESRTAIDRPGYSHLGKKIRFQDLPPDCQRAVRSDYRDIWKLEVPKQ